MNRVVALATLQFTRGGPNGGVGEFVHLVRKVVDGGTPGPTLCGLDRFAKTSPGWSVGGGISGAGIELAPCQACETVAWNDYTAAPVWGGVPFQSLFRRHLKAPWSVGHLPVVTTEGRPAWRSEELA